MVMSIRGALLLIIVSRQNRSAGMGGRKFSFAGSGS